MEIKITIKYKETETGGLVGWIPEFAGTMSQGADFEELKKNLFDASKLMLLHNKKESSDKYQPFPDKRYSIKVYNVLLKEVMSEATVAPKSSIPNIPLEKEELNKSTWISVDTRLPDIPSGANKSENVFVLEGGILKVMCLAWVPDDDNKSGWVWCNCYGDINGDGEFDDDYCPTHWQPLPSTKTD